MIKRVAITLLIIAAVFAAMSANFITGAIGDSLMLLVLAVSLGPIRLLKIMFAGLLHIIGIGFKILTFASG